MKQINSSKKLIEFLSGRRSGANIVVNVATVEFRFRAMGRACSNEGVILEALSYVITIFLFLLIVYGVFRSLCNSKKKIQLQRNLQSLPMTMQLQLKARTLKMSLWTSLNTCLELRMPRTSNSSRYTG